MKKIEFLFVVTDGINLNARAYSSEETLRGYMSLFNGFGGIQTDKKVDDIINEAKAKGKSFFKSIGAKLQYKYMLMSGDYLESYMDFGSKEIKIKKV